MPSWCDAERCRKMSGNIHIISLQDEQKEPHGKSKAVSKSLIHLLQRISLPWLYTNLRLLLWEIGNNTLRIEAQRHCFSPGCQRDRACPECADREPERWAGGRRLATVPSQLRHLLPIAAWFEGPLERVVRMQQCLTAAHALVGSLVLSSKGLRPLLILQGCGTFPSCAVVCQWPTWIAACHLLCAE